MPLSLYDEKTQSGPMHPTWANLLNPYAKTFITPAEEAMKDTRGFLPEQRLIFNAFKTDINQIRVVILGQDPYPTPGHANGLAFSVNPDVRPLPKSLKNIFSEMQTDLGIPMPTVGDLTPWRDRGVMLLNNGLTVAPSMPGSHENLKWHEATTLALAALTRHHATPEMNDYGQRIPLVGILWGAKAQVHKELFTRFNYPVITSPHPSPLSAYRGFFGSKPFSRCNQLLIDQGGQPINWELEIESTAV